MDDRNGTALQRGITIIDPLQWIRDMRLRPQTCMNEPKPRDRPQAAFEASHCRTEYGYKGPAVPRPFIESLHLEYRPCPQTMCECPSLRPSKNRRKDIGQRKRRRGKQGALAGGRPVYGDSELIYVPLGSEGILLVFGLGYLVCLVGSLKHNSAYSVSRIRLEEGIFPTSPGMTFNLSAGIESRPLQPTLILEFYLVEALSVPCYSPDRSSF